MNIMVKDLIPVFEELIEYTKYRAEECGQDGEHFVAGWFEGESEKYRFALEKVKTFRNVKVNEINIKEIKKELDHLDPKELQTRLDLINEEKYKVIEKLKKQIETSEEVLVIFKS